MMDIVNDMVDSLESISPFKNVVFSNHFVERMLERNLDKSDDFIQFIKTIRNNQCLLIYNSVVNGLEDRSNVLEVGKIRASYVLRMTESLPKILFTSIFYRGG